MGSGKVINSNSLIIVQVPKIRNFFLKGGGLKDTNKSVWILAIQISVFKLLELFDDIYNYRLLIMDRLDNNHVFKLGLLTSQVF